METSTSAAVTVRERVLLELARRDRSDVRATFKAITEAAAVVLDVARVSVWQLVRKETSSSTVDAKIVCCDLYLLNEQKHVSFMPIQGRDFPSYLRAVRERRTITADDAQRDPRTRELSEFYLKPLGITSMMDVPIWSHGEVFGLLCCEHVGVARHWLPHEQDFAIQMSEIASVCVLASEHVAMRRRWETVVDSLSEAVLLLDRNGATLHCNGAARRTFFEPAGVRTFEELRDALQLVDAADRAIPTDETPFNRIVRGEIVEGEIYGVVAKRTGLGWSSDRDRRYVRLTCSSVITNGQIEYVVYVAADATEEVLVERLKRRVLSGLAHELKTPLAIAKGYAQQFEVEEGVPESWKRRLAAIVRACDRMDHFSEMLLDLANTILGRLQLTRERVDLADLALSVIRQAEHTTPKRRFNLETTASVPVIVDTARITQAMRYVIDNAARYSPADTPVEVHLAVEHGKAKMSVRDHGSGIPAVAHHRVFELFSKAESGGEHEKEGLGVRLYLAREIVRRHGGEMWFDSVEGEGSVFYIALPLAEER